MIAITDWIDACLTETPPRAKSLVMTVIGDSIVPRGGAVWLGDLIELMAPFRCNERLVRSSVFRLTEDGMLESRREGRHALYAMTPSGTRQYARAQRRIYQPPPSRWDGRWTLVMAPRQSGADFDRGELKRELAWLGFGTPAPGLLAHPAADLDALRDVLSGLGVGERLIVMQACEPADLPTRPAADIVALGWNLAPSAESYRQFIDRCAPLQALVDSADPAPDIAQTLRTLVIHAYRRAVLNDPWLPAALLPPDWPGHAAYHLCRALYRALRPGSTARLAEILGAHVDGAAIDDRRFPPPDLA